MEQFKDIEKQLSFIKDRCKIIKPLVVIRCITYNHEPYLRDALEGFVMQKTDFPFVALIHDDASTDNTAKIIQEYANQYPDIIFSILEKENQYSKRNGSITRLMDQACLSTGAKYVAMCEGDDYWIDPYKLQKQVNFLESHLDYSMCFHKVDIVSQEGLNLSTNVFSHLEEREYYPDELFKIWTVPTASTLIRSEIFPKIRRNPNFKIGDNRLWLMCALYGKLYCMKDIMGVYRRQQSGWIKKTGNKKAIEQFIIHDGALLDTFPELNLPSLKEKHAKEYALMTYYSFSDSKKFFNYFKTGIKKYRQKYIKHLIMQPFYKLNRVLKKI